MKRKKKKKMNFVLLLLLLLIIFFIWRLYVDENLIEVSHFEVESEKIPQSFDGFKIIQISDLHSKEFKNDNEPLVDLIDTENPDIVVLTGDMVTANQSEYTVFFSLVEKISPKYETYYIYGNHEQALDDMHRDIICDFLTEHGVKVLKNESVELIKDNQKIELYGLWYSKKYYSKGNSSWTLDVEHVTELIGKPTDDFYTILLSHNPRYYDVYKEWGADLTLSGHVHGGMVRFPIVGAIFSPDEGFLPRYDAGLYGNEDDKKLVVSRGLGRGSTGFRLFNRPDLVSITLHKK